MTVLYLAGPMSGIAGFNYNGFNRAENAARAAGFDTINPATLDAELGIFPGTDVATATLTHEAWKAYMHRDIPHVVESDGILMLPGWEHSVGANLELFVALVTGRRLFKEVEGRLSEYPLILPRMAMLQEAITR